MPKVILKCECQRHKSIYYSMWHAFIKMQLGNAFEEHRIDKHMKYDNAM